jgi:hypothetical protein
MPYEKIESSIWQAQHQYFYNQNDILQAALSDLYSEEPEDFVKKVISVTERKEKTLSGDLSEAQFSF